MAHKIPSWGAECFFLWFGVFFCSGSMTSLMLSLGQINFHVPHVWEAPPHPHQSSLRLACTFCIRGYSKALPKPAVWSALPASGSISNKTASFYSLLKIAISLKPEDTVTHFIVKRKNGYFFCFRLWEKSHVLSQCLRTHACSHLGFTAVPPAEQLWHPFLCRSYLGCRCHDPVPVASWLWRKVHGHCHS